MKRVLHIVLIATALAATAWWTAALALAGPQPARLRLAIATAYAAGAVAVLLLVRPFSRALLLWSVAFAALLIWWHTIRPSNDRDWQPDVARLPSVETRGEVLAFHNIRNFDYCSGADFTPRYEDRVDDRTKLRGLDLFMSYWGSPTRASLRSERRAVRSCRLGFAP